MARRRETGADIDWYLISIDRLKQIGLAVLLLVLAGGGWWFWNNQKDNPRTKAESAMTDARQALNALAGSAEFNAHRNEFNKAQQKLDEATTHFNGARYEQAYDVAVESQTISRAAVSGADLASDAQFLTVEGDVKYQKGAAGEWKDADSRTSLVNGDWVKTGNNASAELIFSSGTLYTVSANALLEIYSQVNPRTSRKAGAVQMRVGSVEIATTSDESTVRTPGTQVVVESQSTAQVGVDPSKQTSIVSTRGGASVAPEKGGAAIRVASGEKISATEAGEISPVKKLTMPPALLSPGDNQVFQLSPELQVQMMWQTQTDAAAYVLQVSRSRLFSTQEINKRMPRTAATAEVSEEGSFFWRVASVGPDGDIGPFSPYRRFRVSGGGKSSAGIQDRTPPVLRMKKPFHVGGQFYTIAGSTEPGATVFINDEEVDVESGGAFQKLVAFEKIGRNVVVIKAVDPAGNQKVESQIVIVEE